MSEIPDRKTREHGISDEIKHKVGSPADGVDVGSFKRSMRLFSKLNVWVYWLSFGKLMRTAMGGYPICIVQMVGRRSGKRRDIPLIHVSHGKAKILVGSQAGLDTDPAWVHSLRANPEVTIIVDGRVHAYRAHEAIASERSELWNRAVEVYPGYDDYQARTPRKIPVFLCTPV